MEKVEKNAVDGVRIQQYISMGDTDCFGVILNRKTNLLFLRQRYHYSYIYKGVFALFSTTKILIK